MQGRNDARLDAGARGYIVKEARRQFWRVASWWDMDDLIQEGYVIWCVVRNKYPHVTEQRHLMALFKTCFQHHVHKLSNAKTQQLDDPVSQVCRPGSENELYDLLLGIPEEASLYAALSQASPACRKVFELLKHHPERLRQPSRRWQVTRETTNDFLCRKVGVCPTEHDLTGEIRRLCTP